LEPWSKNRILNIFKKLFNIFKTNNFQILIQAEDRAHRIGQLNQVTICYLLAKGTVDDIIWPMINSKLDVLNEMGLSNDIFKDTTVVVSIYLSRHYVREMY